MLDSREGICLHGAAKTSKSHHLGTTISIGEQRQEKRRVWDAENRDIGDQNVQTCLTTDFKCKNNFDYLDYDSDMMMMMMG